MYLLNVFTKCNMNVYFETNHKNGLIYILIYMTKNNKILFNSRDWITIL